MADNADNCKPCGVKIEVMVLQGEKTQVTDGEFDSPAIPRKGDILEYSSTSKSGYAKARVDSMEWKARDKENVVVYLYVTIVEPEAY